MADSFFAMRTVWGHADGLEAWLGLRFIEENYDKKRE
jgi:hypothetical protein